MRLVSESDDRIDVKIVHVTRDAKGKMNYETVETISIIEASPEQVEKAVRDGLAAASKKS